MRRFREVRWLAAAQAVVALVGLVVVAPRLVSCIEVDVLSSTELGKVAALETIARDYNEAGHRVDGRCVEVQVDHLTSGEAMQDLQNGWRGGDVGGRSLPEVWMPTSSMWVDILNQGSTGNEQKVEPHDGVMSSALVIAMPEPMAATVEQRDEVSWAAMLQRAKDDWDVPEHPEWPDFTFAKDDPAMSTSGLGATVATYHAAVVSAARDEGTGAQAEAERQWRNLGRGDLDDPEIKRFVLGVEAGVDPERSPADIVPFLEEMAAHDAEDPDFEEPYVSALVLQEQLVYEYNQGNYHTDAHGDPRPPNTKLTAIYPTDGLLELDHPYTIRRSATQEEAKAARDFRDHLKRPAAERALTTAGFRNGEAELVDPDEAVALGLRADLGDDLVRTPPGDVLAEMQRRWAHVRDAATMLLLLDCSGSMNHPPGGNSRFHKVTQALEEGLTLLPRQHHVGLWTFPDCSGVGDDPHEVVGILPFTAQRERTFHDHIAALDDPSGGSTPLVRTLREAHARLLHDVPGDELKVIVVLTDGENNDPAEPVDLDQLAAELRQQDGHDDVRIYFITLERGLDEVRRSELATGVYDGVDRTSVADAFVDIFESTANDD